MKYALYISILTLLTLGQGCDTRSAAPPAGFPLACRVAEATSYAHAVEEADLEPVLDPGERLVDVLPMLEALGLKHYTFTWAASQETYYWWESAEAQDRALADFCQI